MGRIQLTRSGDGRTSKPLKEPTTSARTSTRLRVRPAAPPRNDATFRRPSRMNPEAPPQPSRHSSRAPSVEAQRESRRLDPGPVADTLDAALDANVHRATCDHALRPLHEPRRRPVHQHLDHDERRDPHLPAQHQSVAGEDGGHVCNARIQSSRLPHRDTATDQRLSKCGGRSLTLRFQSWFKCHFA